VLAWAWKHVGPYKWRIIALAALSCLEVAFRVALPWPMKAVVDHALGGMRPPRWMLAAAGDQREGWLVFAVLIGLAIQVAHQAVLMAHTRVHTVTGHLLVRDLRQRLFAHLQSLSLRQHSKLPVGEAIYRLQADAGFVEQLMLRGVLPLTFSAVTLIVMFGILVRINVLLAVVSLSVVPFLYLWIRWSAQRLRARAERTHALESRLTARLHESFSAIRLVKSFAREPYEGRRFAGAATDAMEARVMLSGREAWFSLVVGNLIVVGTSLVILVGGMLVLRGELTVGTLLVAMAYLGFVYGPLSGIANTTGTIQQALAAGRRVRDLFALSGEVEERGDACPRFEGHVEFQDVRFAYDGRPVLQDINLTVKPGELVALVGPSGSGKTTLVSLIPRFYEPDSGRILVDGVDIGKCRLRSLREQVAIVLQEVLVLAGSIRENLRYGELEADDAAIRAAARAAHAHEFIERLEKGYDTELAEAGTGLSGGEKQRLSIARAFLKNAPILILDEPTAALDTMSERQVFSAVGELRQGRTTFVIAHRLSTVRAADRIIVMDAGRIVGEGTHETLLQTSPLYRELSSQFTHPTDKG
jgi:ATP-binding cassette subfamily B protein/subfamily B ATP-binding cassette protein MsbA